MKKPVKRVSIAFAFVYWIGLSLGVILSLMSNESDKLFFPLVIIIVGIFELLMIIIDVKIRGVEI